MLRLARSAPLLLGLSLVNSIWASEPTSPSGAKGITVGAVIGTRTVVSGDHSSPYDRKLNLALSNATLFELKQELSLQIQMMLRLAEGLDDCRVSVFARNVTTREFLQALIEAGKLTFQSNGRGNQLIVSSRSAAPACPPIEESKSATGVALTTILETSHRTSDANYLLWHRAAYHEVPQNLAKKSPKALLRALRKDKALKVSVGKPSGLVAIGLLEDQGESRR